MTSERTFFRKMEEFGFFEHIYEHLPPEFTAVFEIARILEDEDSPLRQTLEPALRMPTLDPVSSRDEIDIFQRDIPTGEEYEADFIRNRRDVQRIYSWQFLLPDSLFDQRLAKRELMLPIAKSPVILPVQDAGDSFSFSSNKQKVFILFDTSNSMRAHHRIHFAKAILFYFLERNKEEMGFVSLRTFDDKVGEMSTAVDTDSYKALVRNIVRITDLGMGTVMQKAILQAIDDIAIHDNLSGAEILIITDGAVTLDEDLIRSRLDGNTKIHTIKIGHTQIYASEKFIEEDILAGKAGHVKLVYDLVQQERELAHQLDVVQGRDKKAHLEQSMRGVKERMKKLKAELGDEYRKAYGHELERISSVYIEVDDLKDMIFGASSEMIEDIEVLVANIESDAEEFFTPEMTKKIAIMHDHIGFLLEYEKDPALRQKLDELDERLRELLKSALEEEEGGAEGAPGESSGHSRVNIPMNEDDLRDLHFLLEFDGRSGKTQWMLLFRYMKKMVVKNVKRVFTATIRLAPKVRLPRD
jgi:hypothetical protein